MVGHVEHDHSKLYLHCKNCLNDRPDDKSPSEWANLEAFLDQSDPEKPEMVIRCKRCDMDVFSVQLKPWQSQVCAEKEVIL